MNLAYEITVALRYMRSKRRGPVSLITLITIGGVMVGVTALTVVTSVWNGFESEFLDKLLGVNAHAVVLRNHDVFRRHEEVAEKLLKQPGIELVTPFVYSEVIAQSAKGVAGVAIKGIDPIQTRKTPLGKYAPAAAFDDLAVDTTTSTLAPGIFIGRQLQDSLHVEVGDAVSIISPYGGASGQPRTAGFRVVGIFHSGMYEFDSRMVFVELGEAQRFFRLYKTVTGLEVWTKDPMTSQVTVAAATAQIQPDDPYAYNVRDWSRTNRGLFGAVQQQKQLITVVLGLMLLVAAFNIVATLVLLILEKGREIAVLKSLGASNRSIMFIFMLAGQLIGVVGCVLGVLAGLAICQVLQAYGLKLDPRVYYLENLPIVTKATEVAGIALGAMLASTLATLVPAYRAANLNPVDGLRQGGAGGLKSARAQQAR